MDIERRCAAEIRVAGGHSRRLVGYASVFDSPSRDLGGFTEVVKPGAFRRTLASKDNDVLALVEHLPHVVLGRLSAKTLKLAEDSRGLHFEIDPPDTQAARDLVVSIERGDVRGASFAFSLAPNGDRWEQRSGTMFREIIDCDLHEVTVCAAGAYDDATVALRALAAVSRAHPHRLAAIKRFLETV